MVRAELAVVPRTTELEQPHLRIVLVIFRSHHLAEPPAECAMVLIHLPQTVLCLHETLCKEQILDVVRVNVRDADAVADDAHGLAQTAQRDLAVELRQRRARDGLERFLLRATRRQGEEYDARDGCNAGAARRA